MLKHLHLKFGMASHRSSREDLHNSVKKDGFLYKKVMAEKQCGP
jgi:hypothetical protein